MRFLLSRSIHTSMPEQIRKSEAGIDSDRKSITIIFSYHAGCFVNCSSVSKETRIVSVLAFGVSDAFVTRFMGEKNVFLSRRDLTFGRRKRRPLHQTPLAPGPAFACTATGTRTGGRVGSFDRVSSG